MFEELLELHKAELMILKELDCICRRNGITYFLAYGTLLGAVRHKGFIPWDDDIDVCMSYKDYKKFERVCERELGDDYFLQTEQSDPESKLSYFKLRKNSTTFIVDYLADRDINHGINIDIYPLYNVPDNEFKRKLQLINTAIYLLLQAGQIPKHHGTIAKIISGIVLTVLPGRFGKKVKKHCHCNMAKYEKVNTRRKAMLFGNMSYCKKTYDAKVFEQTVLLEFEGDMFSAPSGYNDYLTSFYGDYMKLPPLEEQGTKLDHLVKIDTEKPYLDYKGILYCVSKK